MPPTQPTLHTLARHPRKHAMLARHPRKHASHATYTTHITHASTNSMSFLPKVFKSYFA